MPVIPRRRDLCMKPSETPLNGVFARRERPLDGGFACPEVFDSLDEAPVEYVVGIGKNKVLERRAARLMGTARRLSRERGQSAALFGETRYAARSWKKTKRRVIYKAEVTRLEGREPRDNPRFVVTNLTLTAKNVYKGESPLTRSDQAP